MVEGNLKQEISENGLLGTAVFSGTYPAACGENEWALSILDSADFAEAVLRWVWSESGGVFAGACAQARCLRARASSTARNPSRSPTCCET